MTPNDDAPHLELATAPSDLGRLIDHDGARQAAAELLTALGADLEDEQLRDTPRRMAQAYAELLTPRPFRPTTFPNDEGYDELVRCSQANSAQWSACAWPLEPHLMVAAVVGQETRAADSHRARSGGRYAAA